jgi:hypothetical protein
MSVKLESFGKFNSFIVSVQTDNKKELKSPTVAPICTQEPSIPYLIDKWIDIASENQETCLILAASLGASIIIYSIAKSVAEVVKVWRSNN